MAKFKILDVIIEFPPVDSNDLAIILGREKDEVLQMECYKLLFLRGEFLGEIKSFVKSYIDQNWEIYREKHEKTRKKRNE